MISLGARFLTKTDRELQRRVLREFVFLSPFLYALVAAAGVLGLWLSIDHNLTALSPLPAFFIIFAVWRSHKWRSIDPDKMSPAAVERHIRFLRQAAIALACLTAILFVTMMNYVTRSEAVLIANLIAIIGVVSTLCLYCFPELARINLAIIFGPTILFLLKSGDQASIYLAGMFVLLAGLMHMMLRAIAKLVNSHYERSIEQERRAIAERRALENLLEASQRYYLEFDLEGVILAVSDGLTALSGRTRSDLVGQHLESLINKNFSTSVDGVTKIRRAMSNLDQFVDVETIALDENGQQIITLTSGMPIYGIDDMPVAYRAWTVNVTKQRQQEIAIRKSEARFRDFATLAAECLWEIDPDCCFSLLVGNVEGWTGQSNEDMIGKPAMALCRSDVPAAFEPSIARLKDALASRDAFNDVLLPTHTGRIIKSSGIPLYNEDRIFVGFRGYSKDVTAEHIARRVAEKARSELEQTNKSLEHRIAQRTAALCQYSDLLDGVLDTMAEGLLVTDDKGRVELMNRRAQDYLPGKEWAKGCDFLSTYIFGLESENNQSENSSRDDIQLDASHLTKKEPFSLDRITRNGRHIREHFRPRQNGGFVITLIDRTDEASERDALQSSLREMQEEDAPPSIAGTPVLLVEPDEAHRQRAVDQLSEWQFSPFAVTDAKGAKTALRDKQFPVVLIGQSLGKAEAEHLTEYLGTPENVGTIPVNLKALSAKSRRVKTPKRWTAKGLYDAIAAALTESAAAQAAALRDQITPFVSHAVPETAPCRILFADDNPVFRHALIELLENDGHELLFADNGLEAISRFEATGADIVVLALEMPLLDGYKTAEALRQLTPDGAQVPIIVTVDDSQKINQARFDECGLTGVISKPLVRNEIVETISQMLPVTREKTAIAG